MKSQTASTNKGFTLVEILVVIGLVGIILVIGSLVNIKMFTRELSYSEVDVLVGVLQNARSRAMNNIDAKPQGVHYVNGEDSYTIFEGNSYDDADADEKIIVSRPKSENTANDNISITMNGEDEWEVIFDQLSGSVDNDNTGTITISNLSEGDKEIIITENGLINW